MDKETKNIFEMTNEEASIIIGNIPVYPIYPGDDYSIAEYQWAKSMAIKALGQQPFFNKPCISEGVCREDKMHVLNKIKAEIKEWYWQADKQALAKDPCIVDAMVDLFIRTIDKYEAESEDAE